MRIVNATVVDAATGELYRGSTIVVRGNRMTSVGLRRELSLHPSVVFAIRAVMIAPFGYTLD